MSFSGEVKAEICRQKIEKKCCAVAECFGILLYCHTFTPSEVRIITACPEFAARLPRLFKKAFGTSFDAVPSKNNSGLKSFIIEDAEKIKSIYDVLGYDMKSTFASHVNFAVIEDECCRLSFIRGAFLAGGSVTDPEKRYHLELATSHPGVAGETVSVLQELGYSPRESKRNSSALLYFKQSDMISDFLAAVGAGVTAMNVVTAKVEKEMRNTVTRQINCDSANADKTVAAAQEQIAAIKKYASENGGFEGLPDVLQDAALLRITNPAASLADLASLSYPPVSKSTMSYRLKKIMSLVSEENK